MKELSPRSGKPLDRPALETAFRNWYYSYGNGLFLSWEATDAYVIATNLLNQDVSKVPDEIVLNAFSGLRTQMKIDMAIYTREEGEAQAG